MVTVEIAVKKWKKMAKHNIVANSFCYVGPEQLGSVINHNCAAVGLSVSKQDPYISINAEEVNDNYRMKVVINESTNSKVLLEATASNDTNGRKTLGRMLLKKLRSHFKISDTGWGNLVGVRPMKLYHKLHDEGLSESEIQALLQKEYEICDKNINLLQTIAREQNSIINVANPKNHISIYAGIPFCTTHCIYCSFPFGLIHNYSRLDEFKRTFIMDTLHVKSLVDKYNLTVDSIYVGGGTPTSLDEESFKTVLKNIAILANGQEFTVEAGRPDTLSLDKIKTMNDLGVNRISINPQTMQDTILRKIARGHTVEDIKKLYNLVRSNSDMLINMDFIIGLPSQRLIDIEENIDYICQNLPDNVTIHTLALKRGSPMFERQGEYDLPDTNEVHAMLDLFVDSMYKLGYKPYYMYRQQYMRGAFANIGFALKNKQSVYNIQMMEERQSIIAIGPGSTTKFIEANTWRQNKQYLPKNVDSYIDNIESIKKKRELLAQKFYGGE